MEDDINYFNFEIRGVSFHNFLRFTSIDFENILGMIASSIVKQNTKFRDALPVQERLAVTLRYLTSDDSFVSLSYLFRISNQSVSCIVPDVCEAIVYALKDYIKVSKKKKKYK